jgi:Zn finger protein HypA/HybF involved in hydrogenase expression
MKTNNYCVPKVPTANIAVNKSRIKLYTKNVDIPTYYLEKGQEFQIEIFNPTTDVVLAKISLNNKVLSQGGLVLNPGQRVFLDRYFDVAKKFLFDTYEVSNTSEVKEAIKNNGDVKIEFYRESKPIELPPIYMDRFTWVYNPENDPYYGHPTFTTNSIGFDSQKFVNYSQPINSSNYTGEMSLSFDNSTKSLCSASLSEPKKQVKSKKLSKSIETGRVEQGSASNQKFEIVDKKFEYFAFHTVEYKLLPLSQKLNTVADINIKRYCTNCGHKLKKEHKFCPQCGKKA